MSENANSMIRAAGRFVLFMAAVFLLLFLANLRSRIYYHGPNYGFLLWICLYCVAVGFGLLKLKKWAVLLLFVPGILSIAVFVYGWTHGARALMPWALLNYAFIAALLGIPTLMLRIWRELQW